jgi:hypothetical protein
LYMFPSPPLFVAQEVRRALSGEAFVAPGALSLRGLGLDASRLEALERAGFFSEVTHLEVMGAFGLSHLGELAQACPRLEALSLSQVPPDWEPRWPRQVRLSALRLPCLTQEMVEAGLLRGCRALSLYLEGGGAAALPPMESLEALHLHLWGASEGWMRWLQGCTGLHTLKLTGACGPWQAWPATLELPHLHTLSCPTLPPVWGQVLPNLRCLETAWSAHWVQPGVALRALKLDVPPSQESAALAWFESLPLESLWLRGGVWTQDLLRTLQHQELTRLGLTWCHLHSGEGFTQWLHTSTLQQLHLQSCQLQGQPIMSLPGSLTHLSLLDLSSTEGSLLLDLEAREALSELTLHLAPQHGLELDVSRATGLKVLRLLDHDELRPPLLDGLRSHLEELTLTPGEHIPGSLDERRQLWSSWLGQGSWPQLKSLRCQDLLRFADLAEPLLQGRLPQLNLLDCDGDAQDFSAYLTHPKVHWLAACHLASASSGELLALQEEQGTWPIMNPYKPSCQAAPHPAEI